MNLIDLIRQNLLARKARSILTGLAVAIGVLTIVTLGVLTSSLRGTALSVLRTGRADFSVAQEGVSDLLYSAVDTSDLDHVRTLPDVESAIGCSSPSPSSMPTIPLVPQDRSSAREPGRVRGERRRRPRLLAKATNEIMLGYRAAADLGKSTSGAASPSKTTPTTSPASSPPGRSSGTRPRCCR